MRIRLTNTQESTIWGRRQRGWRDASGCVWMLGIVGNHQKLEKARKGPSLEHGQSMALRPLACGLPASRTGRQKFTMILSYPCLWWLGTMALGDWHRGSLSLSFPASRGCHSPSFLVPSSIFRIVSDGVNPQVAPLQPSSVTISMSDLSQEVFSDFKNSRFDGPLWDNPR